MTEIIFAVAAKVSEYLVAPIGRRLSYLFCHRNYTDELHNKVEKLGKERDDVLITVDEARRRGDEIRPIVQEWLNRVHEITREAEALKKDENKSCFNGWCPNLKSRYLLSREADKKAQVIVEVQGNRNFPDGVAFRVPPRNVAFKEYESFESRDLTLNKIMDALRDDKMKMIGVWGMGGVGKTTLVKQVAQVAEDGKLFDKVVMVAVSREQNLENIQAEIADSLGLNIQEKGKSGKANRLIDILKKKKLLIILDDIWAKLDLKAVGIPCGDDHVGCKIVVTSRRIDVLSQDMGTQPNFEIRILSNDEAWQLFQKTTGGIPELDVQSVARKVAEKCGGLPIALVTVAKALKNKSLPYWDDALRQLTSPVMIDIREMGENVYKSLELSYDYLEIEDAKLLFLLCGLMGNGDISLDDLFKCSLGLGFFQRIKTLDDSTNRLQVLVDSLKASSLLFDIDRKEYVKMHDVVRDVARELASKDPRYMVIEATQSGIHESTSCVHLSLSHAGTLDLGEISDRPKIEFFRLVNEGGPLKIPDPLFNGMGKLKVLHLFRMEFSSLPLSLQSLANLRTLCLHRCTLGGVAGIGELKKLEVLSFWRSNIVQLPREIAQLTCLRWLDLRDCYELQAIPPNILSNLSQLEHLCMELSRFILFEDEEINQERNAGLSELKHLSRLTTLDIAAQDLKLLPKDMVFEKLTRFKIFIGGWWGLDSICETKRALKLCKAGGTLHLVDGIGKLLKKTEELSLRELSGTKSVFHESYKEDFLQLKHLDVDSSPEIQYIVDSKYPRFQEHDLFPLLESLLLRDLINLEKVCHGPIPRGSFGNLKTLKVMKCHGLKIFLSLTMATGFLHLQNIEIGECNVMQQIIAYERESEIIEDGHGGTTLQLFPELQSLRLYKLPELMNFSSKVETTSSTSLARNARSEGNCDNRMSFFSNQVSFPILKKLILHDLPKLREIWHHQLPLGSFNNLKILEVQNCLGLFNLIPSHLIQRFNNLKELEVDNCEVLKHVFDLQGLDGNIRILPRLESLRLKALPKLRRVVCNEDDDKNDNVRCLFSSSTAFHNLKFLSVTNYGNKVEDEGHIITPMEDVVLFDGKASFPNLENLILYDLPKLRDIWHHQLPLGSFDNLKILEVQNCLGLFILIPSHLIQRFDNLKELKVDNCKVLKHVFDLQGLDGNIRILPRLESLRLKALPKLRRVVCNEDDDKNDNVRCLFSSSTAFHNLKFLSVTNCGNKVEDEGHIITPMEDVVLFDGKASFPNLENLILYDLPKLRDIWHHQLPLGSFDNLKILEVQNCLGLFNLIPSHLIQRFDNLKELKVDNCEVLKHVFDLQGLDGNIRILPRLESLRLKALPKLRRVVCNEDDDKNDNVRCLFSSSTAFHNLKFLLSITNCENKVEDEGHIITPIEDVVLFDGKVSFPNLEELTLNGLRKLKMIWHQQLSLESFCRLQILNVWNCPRFLSFSKFKDFHHHKKLSTTNCEMLLDEKVAFPPNLEELVLKSLPKLTEIDIGNLSKLKILKLKELHGCHLFKVSLSPNLKEIVLKRLPKLEEIDFGILPKLEILKLKKLPQLRHIICNEDKNFSKRCVLSSSMFKNFHNLKELRIIDCGMEDMRGQYFY
ncbi:disease resistance protein At4g27190-like isoform X2 [Vitis riparia]|uniref:disease resistance protein At4g27190-like isoform X2 n=1 Tax=Vitis riparia TaxID=96939 RepID=UPI00155B1A85|nr:disease resistance protein At4g27190-like isoform X2 [Vitis riparia]